MLTQQIANGIAIGGIYAMIAVGFSLTYSILRFVNLAHGAMITVGAYTGFFLAAGAKMRLPMTVVLAGLTTGVIAVIAEKVGFRPIRVRTNSVVYFFISSMALSIIIENLILLVFGPTFRTYPRMAPSVPLVSQPFAVGYLDAYMVLTACAALGGLNILLFRTRFGRAMRASSYDLSAASLMGVNVDTVVSVAFLIAGCLAGFAGVFLGIKYSVYPQLGQIVLKGFVAAILGGLGSISGAVMGAIILGVIEVLVTAYISSALSPVFIYGLLILILLVRPSGIMGVVVPDKA